MQQTLRAKGHTIISPLDIIPKDCSWDDAMDISRDLFNACDCLILGSPHWLQSKGCTEEVKWALRKNMLIFIYDIERNLLLEITNSQRIKFKYYVYNRDHVLERQKEKGNL
jgi:hypothetical protein